MADLSIMILEDNQLACAALRRLLRSHEEIGFAPEASSLNQAWQHVAAHKFDIAFLDVHLPDGSGSSFADELLQLPNPPDLIYLTADPVAAVDAFRQAASDYLLKPVSAPELARALGRVRAKRGGLQPAALEIRNGASSRFIPIKTITAVESAGHYQCVHAAGEVHLIRQPIGPLLSLVGREFIRVHRSVVVRTSSVTDIETRRNGDGELVMADGKRVRFSRSFRTELMASLRAD